MCDEKFTPDTLAHKIDVLNLNLQRVYLLKSTSLSSQHPLLFPWVITGIVFTLLCTSLIYIQNTIHWQTLLHSREELILWRTECYIGAILLLPITNLLRYIFLRLNQTMPPLKPTIDLSKLAKTRYTLTVFVSQSMMAFIGGLGVMMFILGDSVNTLYILTGVAILGVFLYRPKIDEYNAIVHTLTLLETQNESN